MQRFAAFNRPLSLLLAILILAGIALMSAGERRVDLWWQLPDGLHILETGHLPTEPLAAFGLPSQPFVDEYGLYEVVLATLYKIGGYTAIHAAFVAVYLLIFAIPLAAARGPRRDLVSLALVTLAGIFMINRYEQRPELVGVLLFVMLVAFLRRVQKFDVRFAAAIALIFAVWTNVHSSYLIGLVTLAVWLIDRANFAEPEIRWKKSCAALSLALACAATLVNPYGWGRIAFTFAQENDLGSTLLSREMWPAWNQPGDVQALMLAAAALLAIALLRRPRPERWIAALALILLGLAAFHIRHISFLAAALLFVQASAPANDTSGKFVPLRTLLFGAGCIVLLLFDAMAFRSAAHDLASDENESNRGFVPALTDAAGRWPGKIVLCHDAEGSFVSFAPGGLRPLIDSGQGRFANDTKRLYFFAIEDPAAFDLALDDPSPFDQVLITHPAMEWAPAMAHRPGWRFAAAARDGLLFVRDAHSSPQDQAIIGLHEADSLMEMRDRALADHDPAWAFCFSVQCERPAVSLDLLDRSRVETWSEPFFRFVREWIAGLPAEALADFLHEHRYPGNALLRELVQARVLPDAQLPAVGPSHLEHLARILTLADRGDNAGARRLIDALSRPIVSPLYYSLRDQFGSFDRSQASPAEAWQDWNAGGADLFSRLKPLLQNRVEKLNSH